MKKLMFAKQIQLPGLTGKTCVITGSSKGMGRTMAQLLVECGARVVINGRDFDGVQKVAADLNAMSGQSALPVQADTSDLVQVKRLFTEAANWSNGRIDFLVCNAGYPMDDTLWETPLHEFSDKLLIDGFELVRKVDLDGARFCSHQALRYMVKQQSGAIVYISSTPALTGYRGTPYTEAKAAILGLMRDLAREYAAAGIRANALALGNIQSGWYHKLSDQQKKQLAKETPMGRWGTQEEVAGAVAFLLSNLSGYINGQTIVVDGGIVIR